MSDEVPDAALAPDDRRGARSARRRLVYLLLLLPFASLLAVPLYNREEPALLGFPFFYWYQFAVAAMTIALMAIVYRVTRVSVRDEASERRDR
jgi:Protein of unknown function (DUF3311)